jgi:hypothetical protein
LCRKKKFENFPLYTFSHIKQNLYFCVFSEIFNYESRVS